MIHRGLIGAAAMLAVLAGAVGVNLAARMQELPHIVKPGRSFHRPPLRWRSGDGAIAKYLGISREGWQHWSSRVKHCDLFLAAAIAKLSNRDLRAVLEEKTEKNAAFCGGDLGVDAGGRGYRILRRRREFAKPGVVSKARRYLKIEKTGGDDQRKKSSWEWLKAAALFKSAATAGKSGHEERAAG